MSGPGEAGAPAPVIILVRPQLGENIGAAARAMWNFGQARLRLVAPECGWPSAKAVVACSGAYEVLNRVELFEDVGAAIADLHAVYATTARPRDLKKPVIEPADAIAGLVRTPADRGTIGFLFGAERTGLTNDELLLADAILSFRLNPGFSSLNLAQAVLLIVHLWHAHAAEHPGGPSAGGGEGDPPATKGEIEGLLGQLIAALDDVDFFKSEDRRQGLVRTIKVMIEKRQWSRPEVNLFRGMIKELAMAARAKGGSAR